MVSGIYLIIVERRVIEVILLELTIQWLFRYLDVLNVIILDIIDVLHVFVDDLLSEIEHVFINNRTRDLKVVCSVVELFQIVQIRLISLALKSRHKIRLFQYLFLQFIRILKSFLFLLGICLILNLAVAVR